MAKHRWQVLSASFAGSEDGTAGQRRAPRVHRNNEAGRRWARARMVPRLYNADPLPRTWFLAMFL